MKIAIAQFNFAVGDIAGNAERIVQAAKTASRQGAALLITPELALSGYPPEDLLLRDDFNQSCAKALHQLASQVHDIALLVGHPHQIANKRYNAASLIVNGAIQGTYLKHALPNHSVFDEERYFESGAEAMVFDLHGMRFGINICADVWEESPALLARKAGAKVLLALNASPFHMQKQRSRHEVMRERVTQTGMAAIYVNLVGGQDELVFDGASFVMNQQGQVTQQLPAFEEALSYVELQGNTPVEAEKQDELILEASVYKALCLGVRDYIGKNGFPGVVLGLSGGIDSALTLAIAVDALGADKVRAVMMPSPYTADISLADAREIADILNAI